jgi:hypothetical protein
MKVEIKMKTAWTGLAVGGGGHRDVDQPTNRHATGVGDTEEKPELLP